MSSEILRQRLRAQETQFMRERDLHAFKHIRNSLEASGELEAARAQVEKILAKEMDGIDVLAEVHSARAMARFNKEDLPDNPITLRPQMQAQKTKVQRDAEAFMQHVPLPRSGKKDSSANEIVMQANSAMTRGRYEYINSFMESMEVQEEDRRPMTKREMMRAQKQYVASTRNMAAIFGSFAAGTAICVGGGIVGWYITKQRYGVTNTKEYAEKMRELTPETKSQMEQSAVGGVVRKFKSGVQEYVDGSSGVANLRSRLSSLEGIQKNSKASPPVEPAK